MFIQPRFEQVDLNAGNYSGSEFQPFMAAMVKKLHRKQVRDFINLQGFARKFLSFSVNIPSVALTYIVVTVQDFVHFYHAPTFSSLLQGRELQILQSFIAS